MYKYIYNTQYDIYIYIVYLQEIKKYIIYVCN